MRQQERQERQRHRALYYSDDEESDMDDDEDLMDDDMLYGDYHRPQPLRWGGPEQDSIILSSVAPRGRGWLGALGRSQQGAGAPGSLGWLPGKNGSKQRLWQSVLVSDLSWICICLRTPPGSTTSLLYWGLPVAA